MLDDIIELAIDIVGEFVFEGSLEHVSWKGTLKVLAGAILIGGLIWALVGLSGG